jgi:hypothetical protein
VFPILGREQGDGYVPGHQLLDALMESLVEPSEEGGATCDHYRVVEGLPDVNVALFHAVHHHLVDTWPLETDLVRAEEDLGGLELFRAELDDLPIWKMIVGYIFIVFAIFELLLVLLDGHGNITLHFLYLFHDFELSGRVEDVATPPEQELKVLGDIPASNVDSLYRVIYGKSLEDRAAVADTVSAVQDQPRSFTSGVETENCLLLEKYLWSSKLFEKDICGLDPVIEWVQRWLREQDRMLLGLNLELVEDVSPQSLHIVPVINHSMFNGVS